MKCSPDPLHGVPSKDQYTSSGTTPFCNKLLYNIDQVASASLLQCYYVTTLLTGVAYSTASYIPSSNLIF